MEGAVVVVLDVPDYPYSAGAGMGEGAVDGGKGWEVGEPAEVVERTVVWVSHARSIFYNAR